MHGGPLYAHPSGLAVRENRGAFFFRQVGGRPAAVGPCSLRMPGFATGAASARTRGSIGHGVMMHASTGSLRRGLAPATVLLFAACAATGDDNRWSRHGDSATWTAAAAAQLDHPAQLVPELALLLATPVLAAQDHRLQREIARGDAVARVEARRGDAVAWGLGMASAGIGFGDLASGDDARSLEIAVESLLATEAITEVLKHSIARRRPDGGTDSFPSGHASFSFAAATCIARNTADRGDDWYWNLGYLAYLPAAYVGASRVEASRHFPADVAFGAFVGVLTTNLFYDAHRGVDGGRGIFERAVRTAWTIAPEVGLDSLGIAVTYRF